MRSVSKTEMGSPRIHQAKSMKLAYLAWPLLALACNGGLDGGSRREIFVRSALAPPATRGPNGSCSFDPQGPSLGQGVLDVGVRDEYSAFLATANLQAGNVVSGSPTVTAGGKPIATTASQVTMCMQAPGEAKSSVGDVTVA